MAGTSATKSDDYVLIKECVFHNLDLLNFGESIVAAKNHIVFHIDSFVYPNKKAYESVMYFLFSKLEPSHQKFRDCWPIVERRHEVLFRNTCANWLNKLALEEELPRNAGPILFSPYGRKFYNLLLDFSSVVLSRDIEELDGVCLLEPNAPTWLLVAAMKRHKKRYEENDRKFIQLENTWLTIGSEMIRGVSTVLEQISLLSNREKETPSVMSDVQAKASEMWRNLSADVIRGNAAVMSTTNFLSEEYTASLIDGKKLRVEVPLLLEEGLQSDHNKTISNRLNANGSINLFVLMELFNLAFQLLLEKQQGPVKVIEEHQNLMSQVFSQHLAMRHSSHTLSTKLSASLQELESSTNGLFEVAVNHLE